MKKEILLTNNMRVALTTAHFVLAAMPNEYAWATALGAQTDLTLFTSRSIGRRAKNVPANFIEKGLRREKNLPFKIKKLPAFCDIRGEDPWLLNLARELARGRFDLFHTTDFYRYISRQTAQVARNLKKPLIFTAHRYAAPQSRLARLFLKTGKGSFQRNVINQASHIIAVSSPAKNYILENFDYPEDKITIIPQAILTDLFRPPAQPPRKNRIVCIGRLDPIKGTAYLIRAARLIKDQGLDFSVEIYGRGRLEPELRQLIRKLGLADSVKVNTRYIWYFDLPGIYRSADIFVMPSVLEVIGLTALEAMSCGLPVVASRVGGLPLAIRDNKNGKLVPPRNVEALAAAITSLLQNPAQRKRLGQRARKTISDKFDHRHIAGQHLKIYRQVL